ncbi:MAG: ABC transporter permease, partial [Pseudomonadota bacterium]
MKTPSASKPPTTQPHVRSRAPLSPLRVAGLALTLATVAFLLVPAFMSMLAGVTANYFRGLSSGLTLK